MGIYPGYSIVSLLTICETPTRAAPKSVAIHLRLPQTLLTPCRNVVGAHTIRLMPVQKGFGVVRLRVSGGKRAHAPCILDPKRRYLADVLTMENVEAAAAHKEWQLGLVEKAARKGVGVRRVRLVGANEVRILGGDDNAAFRAERDWIGRLAFHAQRRG